MGKVKEGFGSLVGNAGEYYVVAELLKRNVIAALAPRNSPAFDILATKGDKTVRIRVKTKSEDTDPFQWSVNKKGEIFRELHNTEDYVVMVNLAQETKNMRFFIVPTQTINQMLIDDFEEWLRTPGKNGREHSKTNPKRHLGLAKFEKELLQFENRWDLLWE